MIADTSRQAYYQHLASGEAHNQTLFLLSMLRQHGKMTRQELADLTGIPLQSVCGAIHRLWREGRVDTEHQGVKRVTCRNGRGYDHGYVAASPDLVDAAEGQS